MSNLIALDIYQVDVFENKDTWIDTYRIKGNGEISLKTSPGRLQYVDSERLDKVREKKVPLKELNELIRVLSEILLEGERIEIRKL